ncbi:uncharacterized protein LOC132308776 isoform X2 [Cornus florida]|uniref:uncharacterized protein LOC132308776 isoform X2 n=1 Tax=Cornus florida TaxID=4283 RepID=UPI00289C2C2F|nr:uncharacterized protein LOC132308776 isoform X2 [Cornus florida]
MTSLQLLSCNPSAFRSGSKVSSLKRLIYSCVVTEDTNGKEEVKHCQMQIFDLVEKMEIPMMRFMRKIDNDGNSILLMVGRKRTHRAAEDMRSPALLLQEDLLLFEHVQKLSKTHFTKHFNSKGETAKQQFAINKDKLPTLLGVVTEDGTVKEESCYRVPLWESIRNQKLRYKSALRLAKFLIEKDTSWEATESAIGRRKTKTHKYGGFSAVTKSQGE